MHNLERVLEEAKARHDVLGDGGEDLLVFDAARVDLVERAGVHEFHAVVDARLNEEGAVEFDDLRRDRPVEDVELHQDAIELGLVEFEMDLLRGAKGSTAVSARLSGHE
jgi:hypothetical protein